jgi:hypothetical protein
MRLVSSIMPGYPKDKNSKEGKIPNPNVEIPLATIEFGTCFLGFMMIVWKSVLNESK